MSHRINRAIALLESGQPIHYVGDHTRHVLTHEQGQQDAHTWADYINVGMEHGAFDMAGREATQVLHRHQDKVLQEHIL